MKRNLNRTLEAWNPSSLPSSPIHMQTLFVLAWFHAVVQVRRFVSCTTEKHRCTLRLKTGKAELRPSRLAEEARVQ